MCPTLIPCNYGTARAVMRQNFKPEANGFEFQHAGESLPDDRINV